ncbi:MAG: hypothetical protein Q9225_007536 [Loekoesia sp. 1 TL-2023]
MKSQSFGANKIPFLLSIPAFLPNSICGFRFPYKATGGQTESIDDQQRGVGPDTDLTILLKRSPDSQSQVYAHALQLLESLRVSPSCNRLAASALIHSCQSVDGSNLDTEESLEDLKSTYAAQLAICEITDAGSRPPGPCEPFVPNRDYQPSQKLNKGSNRHGGVGNALKGKLGLCLQSLESRPQHWTSYSNNRQNAVVMCQAARTHIEKDDLVKLHKSMVGTSSGANAALAQAVAAANQAMARQEEFGREVRQLQQQIMHDLESSKTETKIYLGNLMKHIESTLQGAVKHLVAKVKGIEKEASDVEEALRSSAAEAKELRSNIGKVFQQAVEGSAELAATQAKNWDAASSSTVDLRNSLQSLREQEVHSLLGALDSIHSQLVGYSRASLLDHAKFIQTASNELVAVMYTKQHEMDQRLVRLDKSFAGLESTAAALHATQTADAEAQMRLRNQVQVELQVAQGLLTDITASATVLQATVHDTSSKVTDMVAFGGITNKVLDWGWSMVILYLLYHFHPKAAGYAAITLGIFFLTSISGPPSIINRFHTAASYGGLGYAISFERIYAILICSLGVVGIVFLARLSPRVRSLAKAIMGRAESLLRLSQATSERAHHSWKI